MQTSKTHRPTPDLNDEPDGDGFLPLRSEPEKYYTADDLAARFHRSKRTIWGWANEGKLPQPIRLTAHSIYWTESMISERFGGDAA